MFFLLLFILLFILFPLSFGLFYFLYCYVLVCSEGLEPSTYEAETHCSIQLSQEHTIIDTLIRINPLKIPMNVFSFTLLFFSIYIMVGAQGFEPWAL